MHSSIGSAQLVLMFFVHLSVTIQPTATITIPSSSVTITTTPVTPVTPAPTSCADDPCYHNATCRDVVVNEELTYQCQCGFKYEGRRCENGK